MDDDGLQLEDVSDVQESQQVENQQSLAHKQPDRSSGGEYHSLAVVQQPEPSSTGEYHSMAVVTYGDQYSGILKSKQTPR